MEGEEGSRDSPTTSPSPTKGKKSVSSVSGVVQVAHFIEKDSYDLLKHFSSV